MEFGDITNILDVENIDGVIHQYILIELTNYMLKNLASTYFSKKSIIFVRFFHHYYPVLKY